MHDIICPHCHKTFTMDETAYADIQKQVRDHEYEKQRQELEKLLHERLQLAEQDCSGRLALRHQACLGISGERHADLQP